MAVWQDEEAAVARRDGIGRPEARWAPDDVAEVGA